MSWTGPICGEKYEKKDDQRPLHNLPKDVISDLGVTIWKFAETIRKLKEETV